MKSMRTAVLIFAGAAAFWLLALGRIGVIRESLRPEGGVLSYTFESWERLPFSRHLLLAQYEPGQFEKGAAYNSYSYPFLLGQYAVLFPLRALGVPWDQAHNFLPWVYMAVFCVVLFGAARLQPPRDLLDSAAIVAAVGLVLTSALPWVSLLRMNRDNFHLPLAIGFCHVSALVFRGEPVVRALGWMGVLIALFCPVYLPAWLLGLVLFRDQLPQGRELALRCGGVVLLAALSFVLPTAVCRLAGLRPVGSGYLYRSGLDGSTEYLTSITQAVVSPVDPRTWPLLLPLALSLIAAFAVVRAGEGEQRRRVLRQVLFCAIPYASTLVLFPQFVSVHPYMSDLLLLVPAAFLPAFWILQRPLRAQCSGEALVVWTAGVALAIMMNLLTVAQNLRTVR